MNVLGMKIEAVTITIFGYFVSVETEPDWLVLGMPKKEGDVIWRLC